MDSLNMDQEVLSNTHVGCLYLMLVYENLAFYPKVDEASLAANPYAAYEFVPKLATNCAWGHEGTSQTLTIDLVPDVKWHDGENFTADDVVYTMKYVIYPWRVNMPIDWDAVEANGWEVLPEHVLVEKTGELQVTFTYIDGWHQNEDFFPIDHMWYGIVPQHKFKGESDPLEATGEYIGTGPYKVEDFVPGDYLLLKRFDDYWGPLPEAEQIMFKLYSGDGPLFLALEGGEIDTGPGSEAGYCLCHRQTRHYRYCVWRVWRNGRRLDIQREPDA
jgi:ABC-type transport system substrate-binding protein